ncbi:MAG TPA: macro domain-containing protein [Roseiflexaceae bacterium]|nr:macro domain-containing protein [Roseiflexaceae bacterium]HMP41282.1 macro domain-containing protein [Roseiflexaceae bacterium]
MLFSITLCDRSPEMIKAWRQYFPVESGIQIVQQNILTVDADGLAVPANAFGFTDGGVDLAISREMFDWGLQDKLRALIDAEYHGELLVGQALIMPTDSSRFHSVVIAPTMRLPGDVSDTINAYLAMRAILITVMLHNRQAGTGPTRIRRLAIPGLATGVGNMSPPRSAYQMYMAYRSLLLGDREWARSIERQAEHERKMRTH